MIKAMEGAVCDSCFLECEARKVGNHWKFKCPDQTRHYSEEQRRLGYPDDLRRELERVNVDKQGCD